MPPNPPSRRRIYGTVRRLRDGVEDVFRHLLTPSAMDSAEPGTTPHSAGAPPGTTQTAGESRRSVKAALQQLHSRLDFLPPLKSAVGVMIECIDFVEESTLNHQEYDELALNLANIVEGLSGHLCQPQITQMSDYVKDAVSELNKKLADVNRERQRWGQPGYLRATQDADELIKHYREVAMLFQRLQSHAALSVWAITHKQLLVSNDQVENGLIKDMQPVKQARYNSGTTAPVRRRRCAPNTRQTVLKDLRAWANDPSSAKVYWMNGMAGTGKTTIACTLCSELEETHQLAASFFCSRDLPGCRDVTRIVPTIAYQLARLSPPFRTALCQTLGNDPDLNTCNVETQFKELINKPLMEVKETMPESVLVVVIDALDECSDPCGTREVLHALSRFAGALPIKFFVTCRPEHKLVDQLVSRDVSQALFHLHDIEQAVVQADIETYLRIELAPANLSQDQIEQLAERSGKLFIYAATAASYIYPSGISVDPIRRLNAMLEADSNVGANTHKSIDALYDTILSTALNNSNLEPPEIDNIRLVLHTVICAKEPMAVETLANLLKLGSTKDAQLALEPLQSVIHVSGDSGLVSTLHTSFSDYLFDHKRSNAFFCDQESHNERLAFRSFELLRESLRFNICDLESSFTLDSDVPDLSSRISTAIPPHLFYACRYWAEHVRDAQTVDQLIPPLEDFLSRRVLFWMEVLNLKRCMNVGVIMLSTVNQCLQKDKERRGFPDDLCSMAQDAYKFATIVAGSPISTSTPHIYVSALALWHRQGPIWVRYGAQTQGLVLARGPAIENRGLVALATWRVRLDVLSISISPDGARVATGLGDATVCIWDAQNGNMLADPFKGHTGAINSVAFSFDNSRIASGSDDHTIRIWDAQSGNTLAGPLEGHIGKVYSVAFSPNSYRIASGSGDCTIRIWDARNGKMVIGPLKGHNGWVRSVAFSPNGGCIASGSWDRTIRIWDVHTGQPLAGPFRGHTGWVSSIAFSSDGRRIASGSGDRTIRVWDAQRGDAIAGPFKGHEDYVNSVAFSSDDTRIASCSDDCTVRIWDAATADMLAGPLEGHTDWVRSVAFSPDSSRVTSGSRDRTICVWDAQDRGILSGRLGGHTGWVSSVSFSPDDSCVVSGSADCTVRTWDARSGQKLTGPLSGHKEEVSSVAFSHDGKRIVSSSGDRTIRIWDTRSGSTLVGPLEGHTGHIYSVAFAPDDSRIASGSGDRTIRTWDAHTGQIIGKFEGHSDWVRSVAFSSDGNRIVSGSQDCTVCIWDAKTGIILLGPLIGHKGWVRSVAFSPDGSRVASGSADRTVRIWDAWNEDTPPILLEGHNRWVSSIAFSSDNTCLVSGSDDRTIRIWDARTGNMIDGPLEGHTTCVNSVAFSHGGSHIVSGSDDGSIRIWDTKDTNIASNNTFSSWNMNKDGWIVRPGTKDHLWWVPPDLRAGLKRSRNSIVISSRGSFSLHFDGALLGQDWGECFAH